MYNCKDLFVWEVNEKRKKEFGVGGGDGNGARARVRVPQYKTTMMRQRRLK